MKKQGTSFQDQTACFFVFSLSLSLWTPNPRRGKRKTTTLEPEFREMGIRVQPGFSSCSCFLKCIRILSLSFCVFKEERIMKLPSDSLSTASSSSSASLSLAYTKLWVRPVLKKCIIKSDLYPFFPVSGRDRRPGNLLNLHFLIITKKIASCIA